MKREESRIVRSLTAIIAGVALAQVRAPAEFEVASVTKFGDRFIELCDGAGVPVWMGTMPELGIGSAQALVLAAHPTFRFPTDVEPSERWYHDDILEPALSLHDGCLCVPAGPGLGLRWTSRN
jgi:hypothetical protein